MLACLLQALGGCDRRCGRGCDRLDGRLAAIGGFPAAGDSESAFSDGCLAALGLVSVCCSGVRPSCLNISPPFGSANSSGSSSNISINSQHLILSASRHGTGGSPSPMNTPAPPAFMPPVSPELPPSVMSSPTPLQLGPAADSRGPIPSPPATPRGTVATPARASPAGTTVSRPAVIKSSYYHSPYYAPLPYHVRPPPLTLPLFSSTTT